MGVTVEEGGANTGVSAALSIKILPDKLSEEVRDRVLAVVVLRVW